MRKIKRISRLDIQKLRLSKNEIKVLRVVTSVPQKLVEIEILSNLAHTTVYEVLLRLYKRGLVFSVGERRAKRWLIVDEIVNKKVENISSKSIQIFQGKEDLLSLISKLFIQHKGCRLFSFHGEKISDGWLSILSKKDIEKRNIMIIENEIIVERYVPECGYKKIFKSFPESWKKTMFSRTHITYLLPDCFFDSKTELMMFSDVVIIYETHLSRMTLLKDKDTIKMYSNFFEMMRQLGRKVNSEELFRSYL